MQRSPIDERPRGRWIYRSWITKNGRRIYAKQFGLKAFRFWIDE